MTEGFELDVALDLGMPSGRPLARSPDTADPVPLFGLTGDDAARRYSLVYTYKH